MDSDSASGEYSLKWRNNRQINNLVLQLAGIFDVGHR